MRRAERVHDVDVAQCRHTPRQFIGILLFALVEAHVFQQHDLAGPTSTPSSQSFLKRHRHAEQLRQALGHRRQGKLLRILALFGSPEMRHDQHPRLRGQGRLKGGQRGANPRVAAHRSVLDRHIQILPNQHPLIAQIQARHFVMFKGNSYVAFDQASVVSSMRLEKPHSLSYHEQAFTSVPSMTLVSVAS